MTITTFNANNLYIRYKFGNTFAGDVSKKSLISSHAAGGIGYLPVNTRSSYEMWNDTQRKICGKVLTDDYHSFPDIIFLQEIESLPALRLFNEEYLNMHYRKAVLIDSHDFRQIDVGVLTNPEILSIRTHVDDKDPQDKTDYLFSRDCLELEFKIPDSGRILTVFLNHFKSKFIDRMSKTTDAEEQARRNDLKRRRQVQKVVELIIQRFHGNKKETELYAVIGDFNDDPRSRTVSPLFDSGFLFDPIERLPKEDRWTYYWKGHNVSQIDNILISPKLNQLTQGIVPKIERRGLSFEKILLDGMPGPRQVPLIDSSTKKDPVKVDFRFPRFPEVNMEDYASDHCPVVFEMTI